MLTRLAKILGPKGVFLGFCRKYKIMPVAVNVPIFGNISVLPEVLNIHDNFALGELRDKKIEKVLKEHKAPVIVDCGVNVGVTIRWWFHLNPNAKVIGIDMIKESQEFVQQKLGASDYVPIVAALSNKSDIVTIRFDTPLEGKNSITCSTGINERSVRMATLDELLRPLQLTEITLLKIDIEGSTKDAIYGASETLNKTCHVVFEHHSPEELDIVTRELLKAGFSLRGFKSRNLWFNRSQHKLQ